jgi:integrase
MARRLSGHVRRVPADTSLPLKHWVADYWDQNGNRHQPKRPTKEEATELLAKELGDIKNGTYTPRRRGGWTVNDATALRIENARADGLEPDYIEHLETQNRHYVQPHLGAILLTELDAPMVVAWKNKLLNSPLKRQYRNSKNSRKQTKRALIFLKGSLNAAINQGWIKTNVALTVVVGADRRAKPERKKEMGKPGGPPWPHEIEAILKHTSGGWRILYLLLTFTGMRFSEAIGLPWDDKGIDGHRGCVDFDAGVIRVEQRARFQKLGHLKTSKAYREIPMIERVHQDLQAHKMVCTREDELALKLGTSREKAEGMIGDLIADPTLSTLDLSRKWHASLKVTSRIKRAMGVQETRPRRRISQDRLNKVLVELEDYDPAACRKRGAKSLQKIAKTTEVNFATVQSIYKTRRGRNEFNIISIPGFRELTPDPRLWLVLPNRRGGILSHTSARMNFRRLQIRLGMVDAEGYPKYTLHCLRHYFDSLGLKARVVETEMMDMMGHTSRAMTLGVYGHGFADHDETDRRSPPRISGSSNKPGANCNQNRLMWQSLGYKSL